MDKNEGNERGRRERWEREKGEVEGGGGSRGVNLGITLEMKWKTSVML